VQTRTQARAAGRIMAQVLEVLVHSLLEAGALRTRPIPLASPAAILAA
jgi:hypothetical protein